jgi:hypothetical protein
MVLLTVVRCSLGWLGASGGRADEKDHSSSSLEAAFGATGAVGFDEKLGEPRLANGSDAGCAGGLKADCWLVGGCGVPDCELGADVNEAKLEKTDGVAVDIGPFALLCCVMDDSRAGPGMSVAR